MLKILRKKGVAKTVLWGLAIIIIPAFGIFGASSFIDSNNQLKYAGKVFGRKIPFPQFQNQIKETLIVEKLIYKNDFLRVRHLLEQDREQRAWVRIMLLAEAHKRGIVIADDDVVKFIQEYQPFQVDGQFSKLLYNDILRNFLRVTPRDFEECLRNKLKIDKLIQQETELVTVSDDEALKAYQQNNEKVQVQYVLFANDDFKSQVAPDEQRIMDFYQARQNDFAIPETINVQYVKFPFPPSKEKEYAQASPEDKDAAQKLADEFVQNLDRAKPQFEQTAKARGVNVEESGFFSMEQPNLKAGWSFEMIRQIFSMRDNDITQPIETQDGFQVLHLKERRAGRMPEFSEVKDRVTESWKAEQASQLAKAAAREILPKLREMLADDSNTFTKAAKSLNLTLEQTPAFSRGEYVPKLGVAPDFQDKAFALTQEEPLSDVADTPKGTAIIYLTNRVEAALDHFEAEKEKYKSGLLLEKKTKAYNDFITHLRLKANLESYIPQKDQTS